MTAILAQGSVLVNRTGAQIRVCAKADTTSEDKARAGKDHQSVAKTGNLLEDITMSGKTFQQTIAAHPWLSLHIA
jgi:hypothetical protein